MATYRGVAVNPCSSGWHEHTGHRWLLSSLMAVAIVGPIGCGTGTQSRVEDVHRRTTTNGATATEVTETERGPNGVRFTWEVRSPRTWDEYRMEVTRALRPDFIVVRADGNSLVLSQSFGGDVYRVELTASPSSDVTTVRVVFSAMAD
jgi:hypothetical protein